MVSSHVMVVNIFIQHTSPLRRGLKEEYFDFYVQKKKIGVSTSRNEVEGRYFQKQIKRKSLTEPITIKKFLYVTKSQT